MVGEAPQRVVICSAQAPFVWGGADALIEGLQSQLIARGVCVDVVKIPFKPYPKKNVLRSCLSWRMLDLDEYNGEKIDAAICTKFPSYLLPHRGKRVWLVHQFRELYELWGTQYAPYVDSKENIEFRKMLQRMDKKALVEAEGLFAISRNVSSRLMRYTGVESEVIYPLPRLKDRIRCDGYGDEILFVGRLDPIKRVGLLIEAMALASSKARLVVAGTGPQSAELEAMAKKAGVEHKVAFKGFLSDSELMDLYAGCLASIYIPYDEDFGFAPLEAFYARKPVITCSDSGGAVEFVKHRRTGLVVNPVGAEIAEAIDELFDDKVLCSELGNAGRDKVSRLSWDYAVEKLLPGCQGGARR